MVSGWRPNFSEIPNMVSPSCTVYLVSSWRGLEGMVVSGCAMRGMPSKSTSTAEEETSSKATTGVGVGPCAATASTCPAEVRLKNIWTSQTTTTITTSESRLDPTRSIDSPRPIWSRFSAQREKNPFSFVSISGVFPVSFPFSEEIGESSRNSFFIR